MKKRTAAVQLEPLPLLLSRKGIKMDLRGIEGEAEIQRGAGGDESF